MHQLTSCPAVRLAVPLIAGIVLSGLLCEAGIWSVYMYALPVAFGVPLIACLWRGHGPDRLAGMMALGFFFSTGYLLASLQWRMVRVGWPSAKTVFSAVVDGLPRERARSWLLPLKLNGCGELTGDYGGVRAYVYVPKDTIAASLVPGDEILLFGQMELPDNEGLDFDYASWLYRNGVSGTMWTADWRMTGAKRVNSLRYRSLRLRSSILELYEEWGFDGDALAIVSAVSLGAKDMVGDEMRELFSATGASHVLAVSGLHVGIMYAFLSFLFPAFMNVGRRRWIKEAAVISMLWCYAFLIGSPLSITRSLIMFSCIAVCRCTGRDGSSLNSLAVAAVVILLADPAGVYDIGFQLSFLAVLAILLLQPLFAEVWHPENTVVKYFWDIVTVSLAAQIGTAPVAMYHFSTFSTYFLVTNIVVIPIMFVVVSLIMLLWLVAWIPPLRLLLVRILVRLCSVMESMLDAVASLPHSVLDSGESGAYVPVMIYVAVMLLYMYVSCRNPRWLVLLTGLAAIVLVMTAAITTLSA